MAAPIPPVVVTGYGAVSPLGLTAPTSWNALCAAQCGIGRISRFDPTDYPCQVAGEVLDFDPATTGLEAKDIKKTDRFIQFGMAATREALAMAGLLEIASWPSAQRARVAVILGSGIGGLPEVEAAANTIATRGPRRVSPFFIPAMLPNMLAGQVSILYGLQGANVCPVSACASGAHAIGWGKRLIERNEADLVVVGGAEAAICPVGIAGFAAMRALSSSYNETPEKASRPFDATRDGFVMGEGAGVLILESAAHAAARGAPIQARLTGFGQTADAGHMTLADGEGSARAMLQALEDAGLAATEISAVNAHATSTPAGDELEAAAIAKVFGANIPTSGTKGATGHLLGAAGALEAVFAIQTLQSGTLPPTLNVQEKAVVLNDVVPHAARLGQDVQHVLSNSFGFGGTNVSLIFSRAV